MEVADEHRRRTPSHGLFVYGTLMSWAKGALGLNERKRLSREARSLGPATLRGRLYELGQYPGLIISNVDEDVVHGEVFELFRPAVTLQWLDHYEGVRCERGELDDYRRETVEVTLADSAVVKVSVYVYRRSLRRARYLPSGVWQAR